MRQIKFCIDRLFIIYLYYAGIFDVYCRMYSYVICFVLSASVMDSENVSLIWRSVVDGQKRCNSNGDRYIKLPDTPMIFHGPGYDTMGEIRIVATGVTSNILCIPRVSRIFKRHISIYL